MEKPEILGREASAADGTVRLLLDFAGGAAAECVTLFNKGRASACVSCQAGCACGCRFCATGAAGPGRDLSAGEIAAQYDACLAEAGGRLDSLVFMGMGEPFLNWENVKAAILLLSDQRGRGLPQSRMTVSTVGSAAGIRELARSGLKVRLALSVVTADAALRARLAPREKAWPLGEALGACREYCALTGRQVFLEYVLFGGLNDSPADAAALAELAAGLPCKINLIPFNGGVGGFSAPAPGAAKSFQAALMARGLRVYLRREKGADISAACGQLAGKKRA